ncbi:hypothetical protein HYPSUDRAFT_209960 [Hypholoma sublateritium FD-334 SS-4]|uniref:Uncharacterized protein n=1 Tax=Hypholoma sublateritium (strain FD-334 SS-4) TaxID=945553 RepID=A0A0D2NWM0_HYPSF|nr:hypothetical protein HYPSUDRAFT_209960 [Hypholoma sublateritium FD-334 SS-4]
MALYVVPYPASRRRSNTIALPLHNPLPTCMYAMPYTCALAPVREARRAYGYRCAWAFIRCRRICHVSQQQQTTDADAGTLMHERRVSTPRARPSLGASCDWDGGAWCRVTRLVLRVGRLRKRLAPVGSVLAHIWLVHVSSARPAAPPRPALATPPSYLVCVSAARRSPDSPRSINDLRNPCAPALEHMHCPRAAAPRYTSPGIHPIRALAPRDILPTPSHRQRSHCLPPFFRLPIRLALIHAIVDPLKTIMREHALEFEKRIASMLMLYSSRSTAPSPA